MMTAVNDSFAASGKVYPLHFNAKCGSGHFPLKFGADSRASHA
jgi:hypothetical protein